MFPFDNLIHSRRQGQSNLHLITSKNPLLHNIHKIMCKTKHTSASNSRAPHNSNRRHIEHRKAPKHGNKLQDKIPDIFKMFQIWCILEIETRTEDLVIKGAGYQARGAFGVFDLLQSELDLADEVVSEGVGFWPV